MRTQDDLDVLKTGAGFFGLIGALVAVLVVTALFIPGQAAAAGKYNRAPTLSSALDSNGFETLRFALDTTGLTPALESNRVTLFAPPNDVFEATAQALGCSDALDLATRLLAIPVGDSNALAVVLSHHAALGVKRTSYRLLTSSPIQTLSGDAVTTGVNANGLYVLGAANASPASITAEDIRGYRWVIYPVDSILLPFAPPADLCA